MTNGEEIARMKDETGAKCPRCNGPDLLAGHPGTCNECNGTGQARKYEKCPKCGSPNRRRRWTLPNYDTKVDDICDHPWHTGQARIKEIDEKCPECGFEDVGHRMMRGFGCTNIWHSQARKQETSEKCPECSGWTVIAGDYGRPVACPKCTGQAPKQDERLPAGYECPMCHGFTKSDDRLKEAERLIEAALCTEYSGIILNDIDGVNWFDARDNFLKQDDK